MEYTPMKDLNKHRTCDLRCDGKAVEIKAPYFFEYSLQYIHAQH